MSTNRQKAVDLLKNKGIAPSLQRIAVLSYLLSACDHPPVEQIYRELKKEIPTLSKTTLYNTLELFYGSGLAEKILIECGQIRYDGCVEPHAHFLCDKCRGVSDIVLIFPQSLANRPFGHKVSKIHNYFYGTCRRCLKKERRKRYEKL